MRLRRESCSYLCSGSYCGVEVFCYARCWEMKVVVLVAACDDCIENRFLTGLLCS